jgi:hypothetical protein
MSRVPAALKSPVVIVIAFVMLAGILWGAWFSLRSEGDHYDRRNPSNVTDGANDNPLRDSALI